MRFEAVAGLLAGLWTVSSGVAAGEEVNLLLVRDATLQPHCSGKAIAGTLYGVPKGVDLDSAATSIAQLEKLAETIELPWADNRKKRSSIPNGTYGADIRTDGSKKWMWSSGELGRGEVLPDRAWRIELRNVPGGRTAIQFHYGKDASWSEGCVILVAASTDRLANTCAPTDSPEAAVGRVREFIGDRLRASNELKIRIVDKN